MPGNGSVSGCVESTRCRVEDTHASPTSTCMANWVWSSFACVIAAFRGRTHESLSESRMRETRTSGLTSGSVETEHGSASEAPADERAGPRIGRT